jgi:thiosulfate dehydrogenase [quinone] large subunit
MIPQPSAARTIAFVRILTGIIFFFEGYQKVTGKFVRGGFATSAARMAKAGYPFWRGFLERVVVVHPSPFAWAVALGEILIGLSLISGLLVRAASVGGILLVLSIGFGSAFPSPEDPWPAFVTEWLLQAAYFGQFLIFFAADAGRTWGLDARRR